MGKQNQLVPVGEPVEQVMIDCAGPLPRIKSGNQFLMTVMCVSTHFPEATLLRRIPAPVITKALAKFFNPFGVPKIVQTDQGANILSRTFKQTLQTLGVSQSASSAYHPEPQGTFEHWHQTLKSMVRGYCYYTGKDWHEGVPFCLLCHS